MLVDLTDPILQAIENHRAASAAYSAAVDRSMGLQRERLATDDPRLINAEREIDAAGDVETEAAWDLVNAHPSTKNGTLELLQYTADRRGRPDDDWHAGLLENLAAAINRFFGRAAYAQG